MTIKAAPEWHVFGSALLDAAASENYIAQIEQRYWYAIRNPDPWRGWSILNEIAVADLKGIVNELWMREIVEHMLQVFRNSIASRDEQNVIAMIKSQLSLRGMPWNEHALRKTIGEMQPLILRRFQDIQEEEEKAEAIKEAKIKTQLNQFKKESRRTGILRVIVFALLTILGWFMVDTSSAVGNNHKWQVNFAADVCQIVGYVIELSSAYMTFVNLVYLKSKEDYWKYDYHIRYGDCKRADEIYLKNTRFFGFVRK